MTAVQKHPVLRIVVTANALRGQTQLLIEKLRLYTVALVCLAWVSQQLATMLASRANLGCSPMAPAFVNLASRECTKLPMAWQLANYAQQGRCQAEMPPIAGLALRAPMPPQAMQSAIHVTQDPINTPLARPLANHVPQAFPRMGPHAADVLQTPSARPR